MGKSIVLTNMRISEVFKSGGELVIDLEINLDQLIDRYEYHDAPSSVDMWMDEDDLKGLIGALRLRLKEMIDQKTE